MGFTIHQRLLEKKLGAADGIWGRMGRGLLLAAALATGFSVQAEVEFSVNLSDDTVRVGEQSLLVMLVGNSGVAAESGLTVTLPFPDGLATLSEGFVEGPFDTAASCSGLGSSTVCSPGENLQFVLPIVQPGQVIRMSLPIEAASATADIVLSPNVLQGGGTSLTSDVTLAVDNSRVLRLSIDEDQDPVPAGATLVYRLRYGNTGDSSVTSTNLAFELPSDTSFLSSSNGGTFAAGVVSWNLGSLPAGAVGEQIVQVTVAGGAPNGRLVEANAAINGISASLPTQQGTSETAYVGSGSDLALSLTVNPDPVIPGDVTEVELIVTNPTNSVIFGGQVQMRYPLVVSATNESFIDGPLDLGGSCFVGGSSTVCSENEFLNWDLGNLSPGQAIRMTLPPSVSNNATPGSLARWIAVVRDDTAMDSTESLSLPVTTQRALELRVDEDADPAPAGEQITYTLSYGNQSATSVTSANLDFTLPPNSDFVAASSGAVENDGVVSWNLASLPSGTVGQQTVTVTLDVAAADGSLVESLATLDGISSSLPIVQRAREAAYVGEGSPLRLSVAITPDPVAVGDQVLLEMIVTNPTASLVFGGTLRMRHPLGLNTVSESFIEGPFDADGSCFEGGSSTVCTANEFLNWTLGNVAPGQAIRITLPTSVVSNTDAGGLFTTEVLLSDDGGALTTESVSVPVISSRSLALSIDEARDPVPAGDNLAYSVRYGNFADTSVTNSVLQLELPPSTTLISATGAPQQSGQQLTWTLNSLVPTSIAEQIVVVAVDAQAADGFLLESTASLTGIVASLPVVQRAVESDYVGGGSDLAITLEVTPDPALPGNALSTEMVITNPTDTLVLGGAVTLRYPRGLNSLSENIVLGPFEADESCFEGGSSTVCTTGEFLNWNLGNVAPGQTVSLSFPPTVANAALLGDGVTWEPVLTDDSGAVVTLATTLQFGEILPGGPLGSAILPLSRSVQVGETATAFATLINAGANPALDCTIAPVGTFPIDFAFQATDPATNASTGNANSPVDVAGGGAQSFVISVTPSAVIAPTDIPLNFDCSNTDPAPIVTGLNALVFSADTNPIPDVIGLTTTVDLVAGVDTPSAFAVGSANVGVAGDITVSVDTGDQQLPIDLNLCLTDAQTGVCTSPIAPTAGFAYAGQSTASIAVFVTTTATIANNPAVNRVFIRFTDSNGVLRGATSTAVRTQ